MAPRPLWLPVAIFTVLAAAATVWLAPRLVPGLRPADAVAPPGLPALRTVTRWRNADASLADSLAGRPVVLLLVSDGDPRTAPALAVAEAWHRAYAPLGARVIALRTSDWPPLAGEDALAGLVRRTALTLPVGDDAGDSVAAALGGVTDGPHLVVAGRDGRVIVDTTNALAPGDDALRAWARGRGLGAPPALATTLPGGVREVALGAGQVADGPLHGLAAGRELVFTAEFRYQEQGRAWTPYPIGGWRTGADDLVATRGGAANFVAIRYSAARAGVVAGSSDGRPVRLWILRNEHWPGAAERGDDVRTDGRGAAYVDIDEPRLYWFDVGEGERVAKLSPDQPGVRIHAIVFEGAR